MDSSGEQHLQMDHNIHKRRLDLDGNPIEEPKKEEMATASTTNVILLMIILFRIVHYIFFIFCFQIKTIFLSNYLNSIYFQQFYP